MALALVCAGYSPLIRNNALASPSSSGAAPVAEFGKTNLTDNIYTTVNLNNSYNNLIVVASARYTTDDPQRQVRIRNKTANSFQIKVDNEVANFTGATTVDWLAFEEGSHDLDIGGTMRVVAGSTLVSNVACRGNYNTGGNQINFSPNFSGVPSVIHTVTSENDASWVTSAVHDGNNRANTAQANTMVLTLMRIYASCTHGAETIDYIAFDEDHGTNNSVELEAQVSPNSVSCCSSSGSNVNYNSSFAGTPQVIITAQNGGNGSDGGYTLIHTGASPTSSNFRASVDEDGPGADRGHTNEEISSVSFLPSAGELTTLVPAPWDQDINLQLWLKANDIAGASDTDPLSTWADSSTNSNDLIQAGALRPLYKDNATDNINFNPIVEFDGIDDFLEDADGENYLNGEDHVSMFFVTRSNSATSDVGLLRTNVLANSDSGLSIRYDVAGASGGGVNGIKFADGSNPENTGESTSNTQTTAPQLLEVERSTGSVPSLYINRLADPYLATPGNSAIISGSSFVRVGDHNKGVWDGDIAELLIYTEDFTATDRFIVESYLAIKYGITLDQSGTGFNYLDSAGNIIFDADTAGAGSGSLNGFNNDIFGIGEDDASLLNQTSSKSNNSDAIITMSNASSLDDGDYIVIGNDNDNNGTIEEIASEKPSLIKNRLDREWRADLTGNPGTVSLSFDLTGIAVSGTDASDFVLMIDNIDSDFSNGISSSITASSFTSNILSFDNVSLSDGSTFTIGINPMGPGGVIGNIQLWVKANEVLGLSDNDNLNQLDDFSGNSQNAVQSNGTNQPNYRDNTADTINFNPVVEFNGTGDYLAIQGLNFTAATPLSQVFTCSVFRTSFSVGGAFDNWAFIDFDRSEYFNFYIRSDNGGLDFSYATSAVRDNSSTVTGFNDNRPHIGCASYDGTLALDTLIKGDGQTILNAGIEATNETIGTANTRFGFIGDGSEASSFNAGRNDVFYEGDIAEVILFVNQSFDSSQINQVESYLGVKYGITLNQSGTGQNYVDSSGNIIFDADTAGAGTGSMNSYANDIAGIGKDDASSLNQNQSRSVNLDAIVTINDASSLDDGDFLIWGNDNDDNGTIELTMSGTPLNVNNKLDRTWRIDETGDPGTYDIALDLSAVTLPGGTTASDIKLMVDSIDSDFSSGATLLDAQSFASNIVTFNDVNLADQAFFTLAIGISNDENQLYFGMPY